MSGSETVPTILVETKNGHKVLINVSDFDKELHTKVNDKETKAAKPSRVATNATDKAEDAAAVAVNNGTTDALASSPDAQTLSVARSEDGKKFIIVDQDGKAINKKKYDTEIEAYAAAFPNAGGTTASQ